MIVENLECDKATLIQFLERLLEVQTLINTRCYFVGGCVRDRFIGQESFDYDIAVDGDIKHLIYALEANYTILPSILGTAKIRFGAYHVDLANFRSERYVSKNGLPEIASGDIKADLNRRDFTINTGYVLLSRENLDKMLQIDAVNDIELAYAHPNFHKDIQNGILRILHDLSFVEDPSRMLRAVKYITLYHLKMDDTTQSLFNRAIEEKVLALYSKDRYRQIIIGYAKHEQGIEILTNLFKYSLLRHLEVSGSTSMGRMRTYYDLFAKKRLNGIQYLLLLYEFELEFWIGADRRVSESAKSCRVLQKLVASTTVMQWHSRWWGYETFKQFSDSVLCFAEVAVSIPEEVKLAIRIYKNETQYIKLGINGNTLKNMGMDNGKKIGTLLNLLLAHKVESGLNMTQDEEIKWIESKQYEY